MYSFCDTCENCDTTKNGLSCMVLGPKKLVNGLCDSYSYYCDMFNACNICTSYDYDNDVCLKQIKKQ